MRFLFFFIFVAIFLWLVNFKVLILHRDWPVILIVAGILFLFRSVKNKRKRIIEELEKGHLSATEAAEKLEKFS